MQCIDRRIEISVFLVQPGEFGFELALVFIGHVCGGRKTDRLEIKAVDALWKLSSLRGVIASDLHRRSLFYRKIFRWIAERGLRERVDIMDFLSRGSLLTLHYI